MFIIVCKWIESSKIEELIKSIKLLQPNEKIVVVDSNSENKSYFEKIKDYCIIEDIANKNYIEGALWYCHEKYKDEDFFYVLHDSMILKSNLEFLKSKDVSHLVFFPFHYTDENMSKYCYKKINENTDYSFIEPKYAVFGSVVFLSKKMLDKLKSKGFNKILPTNKMEMEALERIWAIILEQEGYQIETIGLVNGYKLEENYYVEKFWLGRQ